MSALDGGEEFSTYVPDLFRLPFGGVGPQDEITVICKYMQPLEFTKVCPIFFFLVFFSLDFVLKCVLIFFWIIFKRGYRLYIPLTLDASSMPPDEVIGDDGSEELVEMEWSKIVNVHCKINSLNRHTSVSTFFSFIFFFFFCLV